MQKKYRYVYVLRSLKDSYFYVGFTKDLSARVRAHNSGAIPSTRSRIPFELVYLGRLPEPNGRNQAGEVSKNRLGEALHKE